MLGVMVSAACALFEMELSLEHTPVGGLADCLSVRWTPESRTVITWTTGDDDRMTFTTKLPFPDEVAAPDRLPFAQMLSSVAEVRPLWLQSFSCEDECLVVKQEVVIEDASYPGEVSDVYAQSMTEVMMLENALTSYAAGTLTLEEVGPSLGWKR